MSRRLPLPLRTWSGVLLVCALFACLTGLARPAMAMPGPGSMPGSMQMSSHAAMSGHAAAPAAAESPDHGPSCPMAAEQCVAPKGLVAQDGPAVPVLVTVSHVTVCSSGLLTGQPNAPPPAVAPPDLHRLCVSRT
ncbi:hypothetical protein ACFXDJ_02450 [Streptomyces sp. NPDC059443]|uniref:hypothetical protein n=1 Tax=unclassified Streptomyces TaxID=2593676 RepID=UPI00367BF32A